MRVTGGFLGGRQLRVPARGMRPTKDRVRESLFAMMSPVLDGCRFVDLYAGSGAVGLEALSRGAERVLWVEADAGIYAILADNVGKLGGSRLDVIREDALAFLARAAGRGPFDVVFADPPYAEDRLGDLLEAVAQPGVLAPGGLFVMELRANADVNTSDEWEVVRDRTYGETRVLLFRRNEE